MAKVLLINGSPRENGNTFTALSEVAKTLNEEGIETEITMNISFFSDNVNSHGMKGTTFAVSDVGGCLFPH